MVELATVRPCKGTTALEVLPKERLGLDLSACAMRLREAGLEVTDAKVLLVVEGRIRATVYPSGRMLVHASEEEEAAKHALEILAIAGVEG
jgi:hypothetical protein